MKKFLYSLIVIGGFGFYALFQNKLGSNPNSLTPVSEVMAQTSQSLTDNTTTQGPTFNQSPPNPVPTPPAPTPSPAPAPVQTAPQPTPVKTTPKPTPPPQPKGLYKDGQYTGSVADAYYGNIQVQVSISGSKITNVAFLQYPNDRSTSRYINGQAMPYLKAEAISAQSANVDILSGATDSSMAFQQSLGSALAKAKN